MAIKYAAGKQTSSAKLKVTLAALAGVLAAFVSGNLINWKLAPLVGWDVAALIYIIWEWSVIWPMSGKLTAAHALREDPSRGVTAVIVLISSITSLVAVGIVLAEATSAEGATRLLLVALGVASVIIAWLVVHTIFTLRYAELYYSDKPGGVEFDGTPEPAYQDFAYLAFTLGMTFQVSDTGFQSTDFRRMALKHALISYMFGTVIVATTINLIAGLSK